MMKLLKEVVQEKLLIRKLLIKINNFLLKKKIDGLTWLFDDNYRVFKSFQKGRNRK